MAARGITTLLCLLEPAEAASLGLADEAALCAAAGIAYLSHPIPDMQLPEPDAFAALIFGLAARIEQGTHLAVHCRASIGRSGMVGCCLLGTQGMDADSAIRAVSAARGLAVPDTAEQADFIARMIARLQAQSGRRNLGPGGSIASNPMAR